MAFHLWPFRRSPSNWQNAQWIAKQGVGLRIGGSTAWKDGGVVPVEDIIVAVGEVGAWKEGGHSKYRKAAETWTKKIQSAWTPSGNSCNEFMSLIHFRKIFVFEKNNLCKRAQSVTFHSWFRQYNAHPKTSAPPPPPFLDFYHSQ